MREIVIDRSSGRVWMRQKGRDEFESGEVKLVLSLFASVLELR